MDYAIQLSMYLSGSHLEWSMGECFECNKSKGIYW